MSVAKPDGLQDFVELLAKACGEVPGSGEALEGSGIWEVPCRGPRREMRVLDPDRYELMIAQI